MSKYTLTVNADSIDELMQFMTPALVAAVKGGALAKPEAEIASEASPEATEEAPAKAKRGRKPKAQEPEAQEPEAQEPEEKEDFADALADDEAVEITKQVVTDAAIDVGSKFGREFMVAAITKFASSGKLAGVLEEDYAKLHALLLKMNACGSKKDEKTLKAVKALLDSVK